MLLALSIIPISCSEDEPALDAATQRNVNVNSWIYKNMDFWYLWNDKLPASPDKKTDPESFFASLLYTAEDRFSWIQDDYQELLNSLKGVNKEAGYEFVLYRESEGSTNAVAQILYVKPGSPALAAGLKRGDLISHINEQQLSTANYQQLLRATSENYSIRYKPLLVEEKKFDTEKTISLVPVQYAENPNLLNKVITVNDRKIGYYVYNLFTSGTDANAKAYDNEMDNVFAGFKSQGITDLVLDLRYNSGGSETSATNLASLIGKGVNNTHVFAKREYNTQVKDAILKDPNLGAEFLITKFLTKASNVGSQLASNRVYVLTSSRTASASELV
ncbi:MAG: S41 family peptidase, partial [Bacteroidota bacterium]